MRSAGEGKRCERGGRMGTGMEEGFSMEGLPVRSRLELLGFYNLASGL
jgi:hypothetical protein